ncbi:zinc finger, CCHC-type [Artemisia annua]|uniref:Zinc finger, CCHC-type n=1 Tax=Artemisia annua TaxID=35608 RepID=A0A2U1KEG7_ARTAN|nr:zinc finger, CCHC-type [Artemisia annua]
MAASSDSTLPVNTIIHLMTVKLSSHSYLLWKNQMGHVFSFQNLASHIDGSVEAPAAEIVEDGKTAANPAYHTWANADQKAIIILQASLSEEALGEVVGLKTARAIWLALEAAYSNALEERIHNLRDAMRTMTKGAETVTQYGRRFRTLLDQLAAVGAPVDAADQRHWFLRGLGAAFETFSTSVRTSRQNPLLRDLVAQAESHELFLRSIHGESAPIATFNVVTNSNAGRGSGQSGRTRVNSGGRGRGRRPPHCQLCRTNGHYANKCPNLSQYVNPSAANESDLAKLLMLSAMTARRDKWWPKEDVKMGCTCWHQVFKPWLPIRRKKGLLNFGTSA